MGDYVIIESRDPLECASVESNFELAKDLSQNGDAVTLYLVQNGVLATRGSRFQKQLDALSGSGVQIVADTYSLQMRGIKEDQLISGTKASHLDLIVDALSESKKVIWN